VDALTGVFNRGYFEETFPQCLAEARRRQGSMALILIDCDGFKQVNDSFGHQAGDDILRLLGTILKGSVREDADIPFRYGGDEFGVILAGIDRERLTAIAETVRRKFAHDNDFACTLSIGAAYCDGSCQAYARASEFKRLADEALYDSKQRGKNQVVLRDCRECLRKT